MREAGNDVSKESSGTGSKLDGVIQHPLVAEHTLVGASGALVFGHDGLMVDDNDRSVLLEQVRNIIIEIRVFIDTCIDLNWDVRHDGWRQLWQR